MSPARQHIRRRHAAGWATLMVLALFSAILPSAQAQTTPGSTAAEDQLLALTNASRAEQGLPPLVANADLRTVARRWATVMAAESRMYHNANAAGQYPSGWTGLGENVGYARWPGRTEAALVDTVQRAFLDSPPHYANIVGPYNQVGIGITTSADGTLWVTVNFMTAPLPTAAPVPAMDSSRQVMAAVSSSRYLFPDGGATHVVLGRADAFADSLGGAALAGDSGPVLFTPGPTAMDTLHPSVAAEIARVLPPGGIVYILGGPSAVTPAADQALTAAGFQVVRVSGASRVETALAVARMVAARDGAPAEILLARADEWADAVSGGAYAAHQRVPVLLTSRDQLHPGVAAFLAGEGAGATVFALGGRAALTDEVVAAAGATRVAGPDRISTAVEVAKVIWGRTQRVGMDRFIGVPAYDPVGWAFALAAAPWSAQHGGPQLLVSDPVPAVLIGFLESLGNLAGIPIVIEPISTLIGDVGEALGDVVGL